MRWLLLIGMVVSISTSVAFGKPRVAVAPLENDPDNAAAEVVAKEAAEDDAKVIGPNATQKAMDTLGVTNPLGKKDLKKLRTRLDVEVVIHGKVEGEGKDKRLELVVSARGKHGTVKVKFKSLKSKPFRKELRTALGKQIDEAMGGDEDPEEEEEPPPKKVVDDPPPKHEESHPAKRHVVADEDTPRVRKRTDDDDEAKHAHHMKQLLGVEPVRNPLTQAAFLGDAGGELERRTLTYGNGIGPPPVGTVAPAVRVEGEVYPGSFSTLDGAGAAFGLAGEFGKSLGLGIAVPGSSVSSTITEGHYSIGARYRYITGSSSIAIGVDYWRHYYIADRSGLTSPMQLDMPDVSCTAIAPSALVRFVAAPMVAVFVGGDVPLMLSTGQIQSASMFGREQLVDLVTIDAAQNRGADIALAPHYAVHLA